MARILIVDDSPTETFRFKEILTKHGYDVLEASNGADGVTLAKAEQPDLVLMDGHARCKWFSGNAPDYP